MMEESQQKKNSRTSEGAVAPIAKKQKLQNSSLVTQLNNMLCCVVCRDLPPSSVMQVKMIRIFFLYQLESNVYLIYARGYKIKI